jgi:hypothetical protein
LDFHLSVGGQVYSSSIVPVMIVVDSHHALFTEEADYAGWDWVQPFDNRFINHDCCCVGGCDKCKNENRDHYCESTDDVCLGYWFSDAFDDPGCFVGRDPKLCGGIKYLPQAYYRTIPLSGWENELVLTVMSGQNHETVVFSDFEQIVNIVAEGNLSFAVDTMPVLQEADIFSEASSGVVWNGISWYYSPSVNKVFENLVEKLGFFKSIVGQIVVDQTSLSNAVSITPLACKDNGKIHVVENIVRYDQLLPTQHIGDYLNGFYTVNSYHPLSLESTSDPPAIFTFLGKYDQVDFEMSQASASFVSYYSDSICQDSLHTVEITYTNPTGGIVLVELNHTAVASFYGVVGTANATFSVQNLTRTFMCLVSSITSCRVFAPTCHNEVDPVRTGDGQNVGGSDSSSIQSWEVVIIIIAIAVVLLCCCGCLFLLSRR